MTIILSVNTPDIYFQGCMFAGYANGTNILKTSQVLIIDPCFKFGNFVRLIADY